MMTCPHPQRTSLIVFLKTLREEIIAAFQQLEPHHQFHRETWAYHAEGGGEMAILRGEVFEKAVVNWSGVGGDQFPMDDAKGPFFATGISLITHMANPHAPTVHFNLRFIETKNESWFGGGYDLTPMGFPYEEDTCHFHQTTKDILAPFGSEIYPTFSENAKRYFYLPHRHKERGVGGIFFDHYHTELFEKDRELWETIGRSFLKTILPIYHKRLHQPFTPQEKELQLRRRGHYVEFNLLYDRGTRFGLQSGGSVEAIFGSMPPNATW